MMLRTVRRSNTDRSLLSTGPTIWSLWPSAICSYSFQNGPRPMGSRRSEVKTFRASGWSNSSGTSHRLLPGRSSSVRTAARRMSSVRGVGGENLGRLLSPFLEKKDDFPVATRPRRGREWCRRTQKTANVNGQMEEAGELVGHKDRVAGRSASVRKPPIEATSEPDPRRTQAVGSIKSSKRGDYPVHVRRRLFVAACRGPKTDLCAIARKRRFACRRQRSGGPRSWRSPRRLLRQHEGEEPVPQPSQNGDDQAAFRRRSGKQIQLALRSLLPVDVGA